MSKPFQDIEFWKRGTETKFRKALRELVKLGMDKESAEAFLNDLYWAVASEFGG